jgi:cyanophycinase-like exopeptidase
VTPVAGPVALVGSGEFLELMEPVDAGLLEGRPQRAVFLPTASAEEGEARIDYWIGLGTAHFESMGVEAVGLRVLTRADAEREDLAAEIAGAGLIYLSGGNPGYLADTLRDTAVWDAIRSEWQSGAALAGCSAGAGALTTVAPHVRGFSSSAGEGLRAIPQLAVLPHFDRIEAWVPGVADELVRQTPDGIYVVGIDEETALVGGPEDFVVEGRQGVWTLARNGERERYAAGASLRFPVGGGDATRTAPG